MKVDKQEAVRFLKALGFEKAGEWPDDKLQERMLQVPVKVTEKEVPKGFEELYKSLCGTGSTIEFNGQPVKTPKGAPTKAVDKALAKAKPTKDEDKTRIRNLHGKAPSEKPEGRTNKAQKPARAKSGGTVGLSAYIDTLLDKGIKDLKTITEKSQEKYPDSSLSKSWMGRTVDRKLERLNEQAKKAKAKSGKSS